MRIMERVTPEWKQVAIALGFNGSRIKAIEMGALRQPGDACLAMFTDWLARGHDLFMHNHIIQGAKGIDADAPMRVDATTQVASTAATSDAISGNV